MRNRVFALWIALLLGLLAWGCGPRTHLADNIGQSKQAIFAQQAGGQGAEGQPLAPLSAREVKALSSRFMDSIAPKGQGGGGGGGSESGLIPTLDVGGGDKPISLTGD
ncbi:MAG: hypothetical protein FJ125_15670 [Deltaproteobacteria bacterium]|nr:hypothetical protein [Deltaproteobacteria bacterium]